MNEQHDSFDIDFSRLIQALKRQTWAILLVGFLGALVCFSLSMLLPMRYEAELLFYAGGNDAVDRCMILLDSRTVLDTIAESSDIVMDREELREHLNVCPVGEIGFMELTVWADNPDMTMALAAAAEEVLPHCAAEIAEIGELKIIDHAELVEAKELSLPLWTFAGALLGMLLSAVLVLVMAFADRRICKEEDLPLPLMGKITTASATEDIRKLRSRLLHRFSQDNEGKILVFLSSGKGVDSTELSYHQACSFADLGKRVLLAEADLRHPKLARKCKLAEEGLAELLCAAQEELISPSATQNNLYLLPAGEGGNQASELLASEGMKQLLHQWRKEYDWIILQLPSLDVCADALGICGEIDAIILAAQLGRSEKDSLAESAEELRSCGATVLGAVLLTENK